MACFFSARTSDDFLKLLNQFSNSSGFSLLILLLVFGNAYDGVYRGAAKDEYGLRLERDEIGAIYELE